MRRALALLLLVAGCGGPARAPSRAVTEYAAALESGSYERAYDLMSDAYRRTHSRADFVRMMQANPDEARETARRLRRGGRDIELTAAIEFGLGDRLTLSAGSGEWRLSDDPSDFYSQRSPRDTLRTFVRSWRNKRWDIMLQLIPDKWARGMSADTLRADFEGEHAAVRRALMEKLADNLTSPIEMVDAKHAILRYGERAQVDFERDDAGVWKITDPD